MGPPNQARRQHEEAMRARPHICEADEYAWDFVRMPALGRRALTILEANLDSAKTMMCLPTTNLQKVKDRLTTSLTIVRNAIEEDKRATPDYMKIKRCTFRETKRTRCNRSPAMPIERHGRVVYRCKLHLDPLARSIEPEVAP